VRRRVVGEGKTGCSEAGTGLVPGDMDAGYVGEKFTVGVLVMALPGDAKTII
jgi:hypothetical protein